MDPDGRAVATAGHPLEMLHPAAGWAEQDPAAWCDGVAHVVRSLISAESLPAGAVTYLGLASQVDGVVPVDADLRALRPGIIWLDRRAAGQAFELAERIGADRIFATTGLNVDASHIAPKIAWLRDEEPDVFSSSRAFPPVGGYLLAWLTGAMAQDPANASSTMLYDPVASAFDAALVEAVGIDLDRLAEVRPSTEVAGHLTAAAADRLGLSTSCQVIVGTGDEHAACVGAGALFEGIVADVSGTAEPVAVTSFRPVFDPERVVETHAHALAGRLLVENPGFVSGGSTLWCARSILGIGQSELFGEAALAPPGADGVLFLPTLSGATAPRWNDRMRAAFAGLGMTHERRHLARAVLEGCTFALADIVGRLEALGLAGEEIRVVGGGARSPLWLQIKADVTGRCVRPVLAEEPTAHGAAMLAGLASGTFADIDDAVERAVELASEPFVPDPSAQAVYEERYGEYRALFDGVEGALA